MGNVEDCAGGWEGRRLCRSKKKRKWSTNESSGFEKGSQGVGRKKAGRKKKEENKDKGSFRSIRFIDYMYLIFTFEALPYVTV